MSVAGCSLVLHEGGAALSTPIRPHLPAAQGPRAGMKPSSVVMPGSSAPAHHPEQSQPLAGIAPKPTLSGMSCPGAGAVHFSDGITSGGMSPVPQPGEQTSRPFVWFPVAGLRHAIDGVIVRWRLANQCAVCAGRFIHVRLSGIWNGCGGRPAKPVGRRRAGLRERETKK